MPLPLAKLVLPFWYWLTRVDPDKGLLDMCACVCLVCRITYSLLHCTYNATWTVTQQPSCLTVPTPTCGRSLLESSTSVHPFSISTRSTIPVRRPKHSTCLCRWNAWCRCLLVCKFVGLSTVWQTWNCHIVIFWFSALMIFFGFFLLVLNRHIPAYLPSNATQFRFLDMTRVAQICVCWLQFWLFSDKLVMLKTAKMFYTF